MAPKVKEMIDSLNELFINFVDCDTQAVIDKTLKLDRHGETRFWGSEAAEGRFSELLRDGRGFL